MENFNAVHFWDIAVLLANIQKNFATQDADRPVPSYTDDSDVVQVHQDIVSRCDSTGLIVSSKCASSVVHELKGKGFTYGKFRFLLAQLQNTIRWEMEDKLFMYIPSDRAARYDQAELLGKDVAAKFPAIQYDTTEAGNCYACGRSTAVVFHLMRIMEVGVQQFGSKLGVTLTVDKNWQNILDEINKAIKPLNPKDLKTVELSQACANLYAVKLAWRNEVMHPKDTYTLEEADNLIRQVKIFMEQLSQIV